MTTDREAVRGHSVYAGLVDNKEYKGEGKSRSNKRAAEGTHVDNGGRTSRPRIDAQSPRKIEGNARNAPRSTSILLDYSKGKSPQKEGYYLIWLV